MITKAKRFTSDSLSEIDYRKIERDSYSSLSYFDKSRRKYYQKYILREPVEERENKAIKLGNIVDCKLFTPDEYDNKFAQSTVSRTTEQMFVFADELFLLTVKSLSEDGQVTRDMESLMREAFDISKYNIAGEEIRFKKKDFKWLVENFDKHNAKTYYEEKRANFGKTVVALNEAEQADNIIQDLRNTLWSSEILERQTDERYEIINQLNHEFEINDLPMKFMEDKLEIDHQEKVIQPFDGKVTFVGEGFPSNYRKMKYYLQVGVYNLGLIDWIRTKRPDLRNYSLNPIKFIVADSTRNSIPLIFKTNSKHVMESLMGFECGGYKYKGVYQIVQEIKWHRENNIWNISMDNFNNDGVVEITNFESNMEDADE